MPGIRLFFTLPVPVAAYFGRTHRIITKSRRRTRHANEKLRSKGRNCPVRGEIHNVKLYLQLYQVGRDFYGA